MNLKIVKLQGLSCALLAFILAAEWGYGEVEAQRMQENLLISKDESSTFAELPKIAVGKTAGADANEMVERPLFIEGRKPIVEAPVENVQDAENGQIDDWQLVGVIYKDKHTTALFSKKNETRKFQKIGVEQSISGWLLKEILPDRVVLEQAGKPMTVQLRKPRADVKQPPGPAPGRPGIGLPGRPPKPPVHAPNPNQENVNDDQKN